MPRHLASFVLVRHEDETGISGTGVVATGFVFPSGRAVIEWRHPFETLAIYRDADQVLLLHGHEGKTTLEWDYA